ncbi:efflux RND transporter periplasmic adaptor subunit [Pleionea sp. CnH1-48]|uniref:efflux RND transporter periplasmic adaptor subunit n=1 Tax=Pleionea sp. CnH1-48 TaxID=2954494 RepID=UPI002096F381|nr:HlyD family efflux transporter periplasmic adaptor subunit [Pleionea sp. CnH1-48]MCO7226039.1 efflux RND transporter periplasmic adaptor subunit [Pleionea sp. CnH1-48]
MDRPISRQAQRKHQWQSLRKVAIPVAVIAILISLVWQGLKPSINRDEIMTAVVKAGDLNSTISTSGFVRPLVEESIASEINSQVDKVWVNAGQSVTKGTLLMSLDNTRVALEINRLKEQIALKENNIESRQLDARKQINREKSRLELLEVDLDSRKTRLQRLEQLGGIGATSKHDMQEARLNVKRTTIEIRQIKQSVKDLTASTNSEIAGIKLEKSILQKSLAEQERLLDDTQILAPRDGTVTWLKQQEGAAVSEGETLIKIADMSQFHIEASISDFYSPQLSNDMPVQVQIGEDYLTGQVVSIIAANKEGVLNLRVELEQNSSSLLRASQRVDLELITGVEKDTLLVEKGPFVNGAGSHEVFVIQNSTVKKVQARIGASNQNYFQVVKGLSAGDEIIISNVESFKHLNEFAIN